MGIPHFGVASTALPGLGASSFHKRSEPRYPVAVSGYHAERSKSAELLRIPHTNAHLRLALHHLHMLLHLLLVESRCLLLRRLPMLQVEWTGLQTGCRCREVRRWSRRAGVSSQTFSLRWRCIPRSARIHTLIRCVSCSLGYTSIILAWPGKPSAPCMTPLGLGCPLTWRG